MPTVRADPTSPAAWRCSAAANALYHDATGPRWPTALAAADRATAAGCSRSFDDYNQRRSDGTWGNELEAFAVIDCMDSTERPTVARPTPTAAQFTAGCAAPRPRHHRRLQVHVLPACRRTRA